MTGMPKSTILYVYISDIQYPVLPSQNGRLWAILCNDLSSRRDRRDEHAAHRQGCLVRCLAVSLRQRRFAHDGRHVPGRVSPGKETRGQEADIVRPGAGLSACRTRWRARDS